MGTHMVLAGSFLVYKIVHGPNGFQYVSNTIFYNPFKNTDQHHIGSCMINLGSVMDNIGLHLAQIELIICMFDPIWDHRIPYGS